MQLFTVIFERVPVVWVLLGLLFVAGGLYLGFDYSLSFFYIIVGAFCTAYGFLLLIFRRLERPTRSSPRPLSRNFISAGATTIMPAVSGSPADAATGSSETS